jgi:hypothetical protein
MTREPKSLAEYQRRRAMKLRAQAAKTLSLASRRTLLDMARTAENYAVDLECRAEMMKTAAPAPAASPAALRLASS